MADVNFTLGENSPFQEDVRSVLKAAGIGHVRPPFVLIDEWREFVNSCEKGYPCDIAEYYDELNVRTALEFILTSKRLSPYNEIGILEREVATIDGSLKALFQEGVEIKGSHWWERGVLRRAGSDYAKYFKKVHHINVEIVGY
jgi:hypothetical protein